MDNKKIKKIIGAVLISGQLFLPFLAFAQFGVFVNTPATPLWVNTAINPVTDTVPLGIIKAAEAGNQSCATSEATFFASDSATQIGLGGLSLISGGASLQTQLTAKLAKIDSFIICRQGMLSLLDTVTDIDTFIGQQKQTVSNSANTAIAALKVKEENVKGQLANAQQGFWKTLVFNVLIQTSKSVADALVTKLVNNYKINNVKQYADSVATLMYDNQYLRDNFPDAQGQLMARAILNQPELRNQIQPGIFVAADAALGFSAANLSPNDPNFYQKMAMVGNSNANPYFMQTAYTAGVDQAHAQALVQANAQIAQSQGYKTPVNCAGSLAQQQQIDLQAKAASDKLADRKALLVGLQNGGPNVNQSDLAKAQSDYNNALIAWNNVPFTVSGTSSVSSLQQGGGNNTEGSMAIVMCEAISSPAVLINQGIDAVVNHFTDNLTQYNNNNLPSFINLIGQTASQIGSSLIFGGTSAAKGAALVNESQVANGIIGSVAQSIAANQASTTINSITFNIVANPGASTANTYDLNWSVDSGSVLGASYVTLTGNGITSGNQQYGLSGTTEVTTTTGGNYTLTVYGVDGTVLATRTGALVIPASKVSYNNSQAPTVAGAFTDQPVLQTRGPAVKFNPRGGQ